MADLDALFPGRFIKASEFTGPVTMTITGVKREKAEADDGTSEHMAVVSLKETEREWHLNRTNALCLGAMWGRDYTRWAGHRVTLHAEKDTSGLSDSGLCIRVKGSPELQAPMTATIRLPRRKPVKRQLVPTGSHQAEQARRDRAVCSNCGEAVDLTPDATDGDVASMICGSCGGEMQRG